MKNKKNDFSVLYLCSLPAATSCGKDLWRSDNLDCPQQMCFYVEIVSEQQQFLSHFFPLKTNYGINDVIGHLGIGNTFVDDSSGYHIAIDQTSSRPEVAAVQAAPKNK